MEQSIYEEIHKINCELIQKTLKENNISTDNYSFELDKAESYLIQPHLTFNIEVNESYDVIAGGNITDVGYSKETYGREKYRIYNYAKLNKEIRNRFHKKISENPLVAFANAKKEELWRSQEISYAYDCNECGGSGQDICPLCIGTGTGHGHGYGHDHDKYDHDCIHCGGSGRVKCSTCNGHGFFRRYYRAICEATPKVTYYFPEKEVLYKKEMMDFIPKKGTGFFARNFGLILKEYKWDENKDKFYINIKANTNVVKTLIFSQIENKKFDSCGFNKVPCLTRPHLFDVYLDKEIAPYKYFCRNDIIAQIKNLFKSNNKKKIYHHLKNIIYFERLFSSYTKNNILDKNKIHLQMKTDLILQLQLFISDKVADSAVYLTYNIMAKQSPKSTLIFWLLGNILVILIEIVYIFQIVNSAYLYTSTSVGAILITLSAFIMFVAFTFVSYGSIASLLSYFTTKIRQKDADKKHRSKVLYRRHFRTLFTLMLTTASIESLAYFLIENIKSLHLFWFKIIDSFSVNKYLSTSGHFGWFRPFALDFSGKESFTEFIDKNWGTFVANYHQFIQGHKIWSFFTNNNDLITFLVLIFSVFSFLLPTFTAFVNKKNWIGVLKVNCIPIYFVKFNWFRIMYFALKD